MKTTHCRITIICLSLFMGICSCQQQKEVTSGSKPNSPPVVASVSVLPEKANRNGDLNVMVQCQDPDCDPITYQYQWIRNDKEIPDENGNSLKSGRFQKGDLIKVRVVPSDGKTEGPQFVSNPVKIMNSLPVIQDARIEPRVAYSHDRLQVHAKASDIDSDSIYYTYQWEKNGVILPEEKSEVLERGQFKKGDSIIAIVTPDDREGVGLPKKTTPAIISNGPPLIVSSPPTRTEGSKYSYQVKANDPDNDPIGFGLKSYPKGMEIDQKTGVILWEVKNGDKGSHSIEIEASDPEGAKSFQRFTLAVDIR